MKQGEYQKMFEFEGHYWWYRGLHDLVLHYVKSKLKSNSQTDPPKILDAGCGTGRLLELLNSYGKVEGIDYATEAIAFCQKRGLKNIRQIDLNFWDPPDDFYDIIVSNDVIYISTIKDDMAVVEKFFNSLKKGGILLLNLPAFDMLRRKHDIAVFGKRRYRKRKTLKQLRKIGFIPVQASYRLPFLFVIILLKKVLLDPFKRGEVESDLKKLPNFLNRLLWSIHLLENRVIQAGAPIPFGSSLFLICQKR